MQSFNSYAWPLAESVLDDAEWLFRRVSPQSVGPLGVPRLQSFGLRTSKNERSLSFYGASRCAAEETLRGAPAPGWGVVRIQVRCLRQNGFDVAWDFDANDVHLGSAHISAAPSTHEPGGQIPREIRVALTLYAEWAILPGTVEYEVAPRVTD